MPQQRSVRCTNCGTKWTPKAGVAACPVCQLPMSKGEAALKRAMSADDLSSQLGALITTLPTEQMAQVERALAFAWGMPRTS